MEILKDLKPAEAYFLMNWMSSDEKLMSYTLGTLLMEKCFEIKYVKRQVHARVKKFSIYKMIRPSTNFKKPDARSYEKPLLEIMGNDSKKEVQLRLFVKAAGSKYWKDNKSFRDDYLGKSSHMHEYYQDNFFLKYIDRRTHKGKRLGEKLKFYFNLKEEELISYQNANDDKAILALIEELGPHVILLKSFDKNIMKDLNEKYKSSHNNYFSDFAFLGGSFSDFSDSYDSFDGFGGGDFGGGGAGGSWGDGGDSSSGCSSCSGCGGCGGCGGCS